MKNFNWYAQGQICFRWLLTNSATHLDLIIPKQNRLWWSQSMMDSNQISNCMTTTSKEFRYIFKNLLSRWHSMLSMLHLLISLCSNSTEKTSPIIGSKKNSMKSKQLWRNWEMNSKVFCKGLTNEKFAVLWKLLLLLFAFRSKTGFGRSEGYRQEFWNNIKRWDLFENLLYIFL